MTWNYRVLRKYNKHTNEPYHQLHEVYYDEERNIQFWTENTVKPYGDTLNELIDCLQMMYNDAVQYPVLEEEGDKLVEVN